MMSRFFNRGWIHDLVAKARSVVLTDEGVQQAQALFEKHFGVDDETR